MNGKDPVSEVYNHEGADPTRTTRAQSSCVPTQLLLRLASRRSRAWIGGGLLRVSVAAGSWLPGTSWSRTVGAFAASVGVGSWCHFRFILDVSVVNAVKMDDK